MDIKGITEDVITGYIRKIAYKKNKHEDKIQLVLFLKSEKEVGVYVLDEYKATEDAVKLKDVLGLWAMAHNVVNGFISKSLQNYAQEFDCDFSIINCMIWLDQSLIKLYLYKKHTPVKEITLNDLLKE
jgi:hypothetical protein